jgi:hypothetical protein
MNQRQRKKQIKQKIEDGKALSVSDFRFIRKNCPELAPLVIGENYEELKTAMHNIAVAVGEACRNMIPVFQKLGKALAKIAQQAVEEQTEGAGDDECGDTL